MPKDNIPGIWCRKDETFYYLETGQSFRASNLDKLRNILVTRGLITYVFDDPRYREATYKVMTYREAVKAQHEIKVIYANEHIRSVMANKEKEEETTNPWVKS
jgi:hypothetical protein